MSPAFRAMDVEPRDKGILLEPFVHQVGVKSFEKYHKVIQLYC